MKTRLLIIAVLLLFCTITIAQTTVTGSVKDATTDDFLPKATIKVSGKSVGTTTDFNGKFILKVTRKPPFTLEISSLGFDTFVMKIIKNNQVVTVSLKENQTALDEVVVSASRTPERIMESPVTVERLDARAIRSTSSVSFYDGLENLKGVDINQSSLTFKSVNTRGFATFANERFMQLVDGMDNSSPALNFALGNLLGLSELDVKTMELLPGASSALYGANAFNGIMFMRSKNPFDSPGISFVFKSGITNQKAAGANPFYDASIRMAYAFSDKFAAKTTLSYLKGTDWYATDYRNTTGVGNGYKAGSRATDLNYDGVNVYGDEVSTNINSVAKVLEKIGKLPAGASALVPDVNVSRTGYKEIDLMTNEARSVKFGASLNYRPWGDDRLEIIWNTKYGTGNTIYQGLNRYNLQNFFMEQHKLEFRGKNFFVRGYMTSEDAGDSYDTRFAAININRQWSPNATWFGTYVGAFVSGSSKGLTPSQAHALARQVADAKRLKPGTAGFQAAFNKVKQDPNLATGAKFVDNTKLYHMDANLNLRDYIDWAEIQVGGSYRKYLLNSGGTIFTDADGIISYDEYGVYTQLQKKMMEDRLKLTASIRYDKAKNFDGNASPRLSLSYAMGENKNHNFRASFQTGFRNPTTQDQYIGLNSGATILIGTAPDNLDRYVSTPFTLSSGGTATLTGRTARDNSWTASSVRKFSATKNPSDLVKSNVSLVKPEKVTAYEVGYRGVIKKITIDFNTYYNQYKDFIATENVVAPLVGKVTDGSAIATLVPKDYRAVTLKTNARTGVSSYGIGLGLSTKIFNRFNIGLSYTWAKFKIDENANPDFEAGFNTPKHKVKFQFGKSSVFKNIGFNVNVRWQDKYLWESTFLDAVIPSRTLVDAQVNYRIPKWKSTLKIGGTNLLGKEYFSAPGVGAIGSQYFISWTINN